VDKRPNHPDPETLFPYVKKKSGSVKDVREEREDFDVMWGKAIDV